MSRLTTIMEAAAVTDQVSVAAAVAVDALLLDQVSATRESIAADLQIGRTKTTYTLRFLVDLGVVVKHRPGRRAETVYTHINHAVAEKAETPTVVAEAPVRQSDDNPAAGDLFSAIDQLFRARVEDGSHPIDAGYDVISVIEDAGYDPVARTAVAKIVFKLVACELVPEFSDTDKWNRVLVQWDNYGDRPFATLMTALSQTAVVGAGPNNASSWPGYLSSTARRIGSEVRS